MTNFFVFRAGRPFAVSAFVLPSALAVFAVGMSACPAGAQDGSTLATVSQPAGVETATLPDAPGMSSSEGHGSAEPAASSAADPGKPGVAPMAGRYDTVILPGQTAPRLTVHDKMISSVRESVSPFEGVAWLISAGYEQAANSSPNFPQTGRGFAQRLGSAAARDSSEEIFGYGVIASATHQDPRYYKLGPGNSFIHRLFYAGTRPLISRTDGGRTTINFAELGGDLSGSYLTRVYYPQLNQSNSEVLKTFGGSIGGSALGFVVSEFLSSSLQAAHFKKASN